MKINLKHLPLLFGALLFALGSISCTEEHGHDHGDHSHDHGDHSHDEHGDHDHGDEAHDEDHSGHAHGDHSHDHGAHGHGHGDHDHDHVHPAEGPNGGRLIISVEPHLEFLVTEDRKVRISQVSENNKLEPIGTQVVSLTGGDRANPTRMKFDLDGDTLISDTAFPEGESFPVILQIKASAGADPFVEKFNLELGN